MSCFISNNTVNGDRDNMLKHIVDAAIGETSIPKIYAGGDVAPTGPSTAINAMGAGKRAAKAINELLK